LFKGEEGAIHAVLP